MVVFTSGTTGRSQNVPHDLEISEQSIYAWRRQELLLFDPQFLPSRRRSTSAPIISAIGSDQRFTSRAPRGRRGRHPKGFTSPHVVQQLVAISITGTGWVGPLLTLLVHDTRLSRDTDW